MRAIREESYRLIPRELSIEYAGLESGLDRFVKPEKGDFLGREGLLAGRPAALPNHFVTLEVRDATSADARGKAPILHRGRLVGRATSGGYSWRLGKSLALAMVAPHLAETGTELDIVILGKTHRAVVVPESPFDSENARLRA